jgi:hypothetical protein
MKKSPEKVKRGHTQKQIIVELINSGESSIADSPTVLPPRNKSGLTYY